MPIHCPIATQRITQDEFKQIAGEVIQHVFTIHNEFAPNVAFKITAPRSRLGEFESHAKRLIGHTTLKTVHWANITQASVTFTTLTG